MRRLGSFAAGVGGAATGFVAEYFLDPDRGRSRRARFRDRARAVPRRVRRRVLARTGAQARYASGVIHGVAHRATHPRGHVPADDATLTHKVRSEVLGSAPFAHRHIAVTSVNGTVTLRGQLPEGSQIQALEERVARVAGVRTVENFVHLPGTPAPNKAAARSIS
jgi:osmotically-inducible protein OsmY